MARQIQKREITVYIAATFARQTEMQDVRNKMHRCYDHPFHSFRCTAGWLDQTAGNQNIPSHFHTAMEMADRDTRDIKRSNCMLLFTNDPEGVKTGGGRHTEVGIALSEFLPIFLIGPRENVFHYHPSICACVSVEEAFLAMTQRFPWKENGSEDCCK